MNDNETREIKEEVLNRILPKMNKEFIEKLPASPKELLKYAKRRVNPFISESIDKDLANKMLNSRLSDEEYLLTFFKIICDACYNKQPSDFKKVKILVSQTGAGKTKLKELILKEDNNMVQINADKYKSFRSDFNKILNENPSQLGALTGIDSYDHSRNVTDFALDKSYNLIIECAPSVNQGLINIDVDKINSKGYDKELHVLSVGNLRSSIGIHYRYEKAINNNSKTTKLTDLARHDDSYNALPMIIKNYDFSSINIYKRENPFEKNKVIQSAIVEGKDKELALRVLESERKKSNDEYIINKEFEKDYNIIVDSMNRRNASQKDIKQFNNVCDRYYEFLKRYEK